MNKYLVSLEPSVGGPSRSLDDIVREIRETLGVSLIMATVIATSMYPTYIWLGEIAMSRLENRRSAIDMGQISFYNWSAFYTMRCCVPADSIIFDIA